MSRLHDVIIASAPTMAGECKRCGKCCMVIAVAIPHGLSPDQENYYLEHGCGILPPKYPAPGLLIIPSKCQHLQGDPESGEECTCDIHESAKYPAVCRLFTGNQHGYLLFRGCGFT